MKIDIELISGERIYMDICLEDMDPTNQQDNLVHLSEALGSNFGLELFRKSHSPHKKVRGYYLSIEIIFIIFPFLNFQSIFTLIIEVLAGKGNHDIKITIQGQTQYSQISAVEKEKIPKITETFMFPIVKVIIKFLMK